jgi:DNA-binding MarR family transcriptional regulator
MSPSALAAEMLILPGNAAELLKKLTDEGLVLMRDDADSADGKLVALSADARDLLDTGSARQMKR